PIHTLLCQNPSRNKRIPHNLDLKLEGFSLTSGTSDTHPQPASVVSFLTQAIAPREHCSQAGATSTTTLSWFFLGLALALHFFFFLLASAVHCR
ncbi:hypothetical protein PG988_008594, partial [Apiospora saccharicola]